MIEPRPAATVVVARNAQSGLELLLLRRTESAVFMPGAYVFPGGAVDRRDHDPALAMRAPAPGIDGAALNRLLDTDSGGAAYLMAAIRECFEEAGLLLADQPGTPLDAPHPALQRQRRAMASGELTLAGLCRDLDLQLHTDRIGYLGRWITPPGPPRRFDTRFFVAPIPAGQIASHDGTETTAHLWISPRQALDRNRAGTLPLGKPTIRILHRLAGFDTIDRLLRRTGLPGIREQREPLAAAGQSGVRRVGPDEPAYAEIAKLSQAGLGSPTYDIVPDVVRRLSARVTRLTAANPGLMTGPGTNTYLVDGGDGLAVIDPGPALEPHLDAIQSQLGQAGLRAILVTHTHHDHSPGAGPLRERTGAPTMGMPPPDAGDQDSGFVPDRVLRDGERLSLGAVTLRALHTPGHASNHLCYLLEEEGMLFSGDHIMQGSTVIVNPPDGHMADYLQSLDGLHNEEIAHIAPGHGFLMDEPGAVIDDIIRHRMRREAKVADAVDRLGSATEGQLVEAVYDDVPVALHGAARRSLLAHLIKLQDEGMVWVVGGRWQLTPVSNRADS